MDEVRDDTGRETVRPATERAEELIDRATRGASYLASLAAMHLMRGASLAREEAEDIWAEAQSLRYRERQGVEPDAGGSGNVVAPDVQQAANVATDTVQNAAQQAAASAGSVVEGATEAIRSKAEELGLMETPTIKVTEAARRKAEELGVALAGLQGTGAGGQITVEDVKKRAKAERA